MIEEDQFTNSPTVYTERIKAGGRTYFIDLKNNNRVHEGLYLVITESKKKSNENDRQFFRKSKIVIYPEDIQRFSKAIANVFEQFKKKMPNFDFHRFEKRDAVWAEEAPYHKDPLTY